MGNRGQVTALLRDILCTTGPSIGERGFGEGTANSQT